MSSSPKFPALSVPGICVLRENLVGRAVTQRILTLQRYGDTDLSSEAGEEGGGGMRLKGYNALME